ncbi:MAG: hypothetical protein OEW37_00165 [Rhodospirillaceae bacterium]|nr:hypothetical protein [Rhodospirillaceae bacterium]
MSFWSEALIKWQDAYKAVADGKSYSMNGRTLTYEDADVILKQIQTCERMVRGENNATTGVNSTISLADFS